MPIEVDLPSGKRLVFHHLVLDFTGTLSLDGRLLAGVAERLTNLSKQLQIIVLTVDTFGTAREALKDLPVKLEVISTGRDKEKYIEGLGPESVVAIGNGQNDAAMLRRVALGIAVVGPEGAAAECIPAADVVTSSIIDALDLLTNPLRLKATLRE